MAGKSCGGPVDAGYTSKTGRRARLCGYLSESLNGCEGAIVSGDVGVGRFGVALDAGGTKAIKFQRVEFLIFFSLASPAGGWQQHALGRAA